MLTFTLREDFDLSTLETGSLCLGYKKIEFLANLGPFPGGGDCLIVRTDDGITMLNSNDLIHDIEAYSMSETDPCATDSKSERKSTSVRKDALPEPARKRN